MKRLPSPTNYAIADSSCSGRPTARGRLADDKSYLGATVRLLVTV